jgi:hypothetical protein
MRVAVLVQEETQLLAQQVVQVVAVMLVLLELQIQVAVAVAVLALAWLAAQA